MKRKAQKTTLFSLWQKPEPAPAPPPPPVVLVAGNSCSSSTTTCGSSGGGGGGGDIPKRRRSSGPTTLSLRTVVVGRQFHASSVPGGPGGDLLAPGSVLQLLREPGNKYDPNAVLVLLSPSSDDGAGTGDSRNHLGGDRSSGSMGMANEGGGYDDDSAGAASWPLGHLPRRYASHISPLLERHLASIRTVVAEEPPPLT